MSINSAVIKSVLFFILVAIAAFCMTSCGHWQCPSDGRVGYTDAPVHAVKGAARKSY